MPWQETCAVNERTRFILAYLQGDEPLAALCRQYDISRKTAYKWLGRFQAGDFAALADRPHTPRRCPHAVTPEVQEAILDLRNQHPSWGPKKLAAFLQQQHPQMRVPAPSTIGALLKRNGLSTPRRRRRHVPPRTQPLAHASAPNSVWCVDFKGDFALGSGQRCHPLTISDAASRFFLGCYALEHTTTAIVQPLLEATFRQFGLPERIRSDNGPPFASTGAAGLTRLSVWWVRLGIYPERIDPGKPQQNGRHERLHRTLKADACQPPASSLAGQQARFDAFRQSYNQERPHEALGQRQPAAVYAPSPRPFPEQLPELVYPDATVVRTVRANGTVRWLGEEVYVGQVLTGEPLGFTQIAEQLWQVAFGPLLLGSWLPGSNRLLPLPSDHAILSPIMPV